MYYGTSGIIHKTGMVIMGRLSVDNVLSSLKKVHFMLPTAVFIN